MPWYSRFIIVLLFVGCTSQPQIGKKAFQKEDEFIIKAILAMQTDTKKAIDILENLYQKTGKYIYLIEVIKLYFLDKNYNKTIQLTDQFIKKFPNKKVKVFKYKIYSYIKQKKFHLALTQAKQLLKQNRDLDTYKLIAYIYISNKKYKEAIKYLKSAYAISKSPKILTQMGDLFFKHLKKPNEAISYYQTHIRLYGCEDSICNKLAQIYKFLYDYDNLIAIYKKLYNYTNNFEYANKIVYLYIENEQYNKAISFINRYKLNNLLKLVYKARLQKTNNYQDAYKLYQITKKLDYLFLYSVYKFKTSPKGLVNLKNLISNLENLISKKRDPTYLNYLGYTLIDYDIDPKKGIELVKEALQSEPNTMEFLDSLAWGYYKIKECKKAYEIITKLNSDDKEVKKHKKYIRRCYDTRQNHRKNKTKSQKGKHR